MYLHRSSAINVGRITHNLASCICLVAVYWQEYAQFSILYFFSGCLTAHSGGWEGQEEKRSYIVAFSFLNFKTERWNKHISHNFNLDFKPPMVWESLCHGVTYYLFKYLLLQGDDMTVG